MQPIKGCLKSETLPLPERLHHKRRVAATPTWPPSACNKRRLFVFSASLVAQKNSPGLTSVVCLMGGSTLKREAEGFSDPRPRRATALG